MALDYTYLVHMAFVENKINRENPPTDPKLLEYVDRRAVEALYYAAFHSVRSILSQKLIVSEKK
jgi:uncharacterized protein (UPF0332 family)